VTASLLAAYVHGPRTAALTRALHSVAGGDENLSAVFNAVHCSDMDWPRNWARWDADARRALPSARLVTVTGSGSRGQSLAIVPDRCANGWLARYLATGALPSGPGLVSATCAAPSPPPPLRIPLRPAASPAPSRAS
jgi:hypothetical protein